MTSPYPLLFSPIRVGSVALPNRILMGSMHTGLEEAPDAFARMAAFYAERARGGAALMVTGGVSPDAAGKLGLGPGEKTLQEDPAGHRLVTRAVHAEGGRILVQLLHAGRYGKHPGAVAPSPVRAPINPHPPRGMAGAEIEETIHAFAESAALAVELGYDGIEAMGSEGYLPSQFLAPRTNARTDEWGGPWENRKRFFVEAVRAIRARIGPGPILVARLSVLELVEGGMTGAETIDLARSLEAAGADALNSGIGWHEARVPTIMHSVPRGAFAWATRRVARAVSIPTVASNRIAAPDQAEALVAAGDAAMVSMARPFLADAEFVAKARDGRAAEINTCIACNQACLDNIFSARIATCMVNPRACRETEPGLAAAPAAAPRRLAVVGGGPGGLAAAAALAERGHSVALFEARDRLGGQFDMAMAIPGKEEYGETARYFAARLERLGVEVRLSAPATAEGIAAGGFDAVVLASGVVPRRPEIEGIDHPMVLSYLDVLRDRAPVGARVAIIGAGGIGFDVAEFLSRGGPGDGGEGDEDRDRDAVDRFLAEWGVDRGLDSAGGLVARPAPPPPPARRIVLCQRSGGRFGRTLGKSTGWAIRAGLAARGVAFLGGVAYRRIDARGLHVAVGGEERLVEADNVVVCAGQEPRRDLLPGLEAAGIPVHPIGGAARASELDAQRAIEEATRLAATL